MEASREQERAAALSGGVSLVMAGAGSGKTRTLVMAIGHAVRVMGIPPEKVLALSFSRKAAEELRARVSAVTEKGTPSINAGTIHSFSYGLIQEFAPCGGDFTVLDGEKSDRVLEEIVTGCIGDFRGMPVPVICSLVRNPPAPGSPLERMLHAAGLRPMLADTVLRYTEWKRDHRALDFDDMIVRAADLLAGNAALRGTVNERYGYIFVDEFQDISAADFRLLRLLGPDGGGNLFAVGDDWQSIYGFRNARVEYLVRMKKYFPGATIHTLTANYRSRKEILKLAGHFIERNRFRTRRTSRAMRGPGGEVRRCLVDGAEGERDAVDEILERERLRGGSCAVLYRNSWIGERLQKGIGDARRDHAEFMTMHASKGLEFDTVVIVGISDQVIPDRETPLEEERRLMYVALTRARDRLYILVRREESGGPGRFGRELGFA